MGKYFAHQAELSASPITSATTTEWIHIGNLAGKSAVMKLILDTIASGVGRVEYSADGVNVDEIGISQSITDGSVTTALPISTTHPYVRFNLQSGTVTSLTARVDVNILG